MNLLTFQNVVTNTLYIILMLIEFTQFLGFVLYKLTLSGATTSSFAYSSTGISSNGTSSVKTAHLYYVSYFNIKQFLMEARNTFEDESSGQMASFIIAGLALFIIVLNFIVIAILCRYSKDGYDALFSSQLTKMMLKVCGVAQIVFLKVLFLPLMIILISIVICSEDLSLTKPNGILSSNSATGPRSYYYGGFVCWTIPHIVLTAFCMVFAFLLLGATALFSLLFNDIRFHS